MKSLQSNNGRAVLVLLITSVLCWTLYSFATQRKVSIVTSQNEITLTNSASSSVTYSIVCFDKNGTQRLSETGQTLASKASRRVGPTKCPDGQPPNKRTTDDSVFSCYASNRGSDLAVFCPAGMTPCNSGSLNTQVTNGNLPTSGTNNFFVSDFSFTPYTYSNDGGTNYYSGYGYPKWSNEATYKCKDSSNVVFDKCSYGGLYGDVACCPTASYLASVSSCDVTITSSSGHLQSPQFKGGSPF